MIPISDEELVAGCRAASNPQERNALLHQLFERHYRRVALWCLRWSGNREEAQDLAQEIFLKVHRNIDSFQGTSKFSTWLYTVCRNHCINAGASSRTRECVELDDMLAGTLRSPDPGPEEQLQSSRQMDEARELIEQHLDETERNVLLLHYVEGWSLPMVSRALKLTNASGAKAYIVSGLRKLRTALERRKARTPSAE